MTQPGESWQERDLRRAVAAQEARGLPREPSSPVVHVVLGLAVVGWLAVLGWAWAVLPDRVPLHWGDGSGHPDRWGSRTESLVTSVVIGLLVLAMPLVSRLAFTWPDGINVPHKQWWLDRADRLVTFERLVREDLQLMTAVTLGLMAALELLTVWSARRGDGVLPDPWFWALLGVYLAVVAVVVIRMVAGPRYRPRKP